MRVLVALIFLSPFEKNGHFFSSRIFLDGYINRRSCDIHLVILYVFFQFTGALENRRKGASCGIEPLHLDWGNGCNLTWAS